MHEECGLNPERQGRVSQQGFLQFLKNRDGYRWHLDLQFLKDVDPMQVEELGAILRTRRVDACIVGKKGKKSGCRSGAAVQAAL
ncbi:hypothetical protein [Rhizobium subbaraonis]|uniref:hypothetical protein n=1 Tax=Rhizobium subbaraonis TaxID=908946 RepID=UPI000BE24221|nr:hypothetical protein [Rhizobium subbaraonis]